MTWPDSGLIWTMKSVYQTFAHTAPSMNSSSLRCWSGCPFQVTASLRLGVKRLRVAVGQDVRAVALDEARAVVGEAPALSLVPELAKQAQRAEVVDEGAAGLPRELDEPVAHAGEPLSEHVSREIHAAERPGRSATRRGGASTGRGGPCSRRTRRRARPAPGRTPGDREGRSGPLPTGAAGRPRPPRAFARPARGRPSPPPPRARPARARPSHGVRTEAGHGQAVKSGTCARSSILVHASDGRAAGRCRSSTRHESAYHARLRGAFGRPGPSRSPRGSRDGPVNPRA